MKTIDRDVFETTGINDGNILWEIRGYTQAANNDEDYNQHSATTKTEQHPYRLPIRTETKKQEMSIMNSEEVTKKTEVVESQKPEPIPEECYEIRSIPIEQIKVADFCRRRALKKDLKSLTESIQRRGLIQSPVVLDSNNGSYSLIAGSRRFQACKSLGWKTIPCCVKKIDTRNATFLSFAENAVREMVHPIEEARKLKKMKEETGMVDEEIAKEVGLAQSTVTGRLSMLDLGDDILKKIDTRPEAAFKPTHAIVLAQFQRTDRYKREIEIRELQGKTIEHKLSSGQLRSLVQLFKNGDYDHLPEKLQMLLMKDKNMDAEMVKLFLHPEKFIDDSVSEAELLRKKASELAKQQRKDFVEDALNNNWPEKEIKARLIKLIRASTKPDEKNEDKRPDSTVETLSSNLISLMDKLQNSRYQVHSLDKSKPDEAARLRKIGSQPIRQLGQDKRRLVRIQTVDDVVSAVMTVNRQPMRHDTLVDWLGVKRPIHEATLHLSSLRITSVDRDSKEFLPGETFGYGWELVNNEDGWAPTESRQYIIRWACINGMIGLDKMSSLRRMPKSREPIFKSLERLGSILDDVTEFKDLGNAVQWAVERQLGPEHEAVVSYLAGRLEGKATMIALDKITAASSWYELLNAVTSLARTHQLDMRRRYEFEGGRLVKWFSGLGRVRPPWQKKSCQECVAWN